MSNFKLEPELYFQTLWFIRRYEDLKRDRDAVLCHTPKREGARGSGISDPTYTEAALLLAIDSDIQAIECALTMIPKEYRAGVMASIIDRARYPDTANIKTWKKWRQRFIYYTARFKGWT